MTIRVLMIFLNLVTSKSHGYSRGDLTIEAKLLAKAHSRTDLSSIRLQYQVYLQHKNQCEYEGKLELLPLGCLAQLGVLYKWGIVDKTVFATRKKELVKICELRASQQSEVFELQRAIQDKNLSLTTCFQLAKKRMDILTYKNPELAKRLDPF